VQPEKVSLAGRGAGVGWHPTGESATVRRRAVSIGQRQLHARDRPVPGALLLLSLRG